MRIQYKKKRNLLQNLLLVELMQGMWLTLKRLFSKPITLQYPHEMPVVRRGFRGQHAMVRNPKTGQARCIGCMKCVSVCPSRCIHVHAGKDPETNRRVVDRYDVDALRCVYCGFCAEICPVNAIILTEVFSYSAQNREALHWDLPHLLENWDQYLASTGESLEHYVNPTWRPRGFADKLLPPGKRLPVDEEWKGEKQVTGRVWQQSVSEQGR